MIHEASGKPINYLKGVETERGFKEVPEEEIIKGSAHQSLPPAGFPTHNISCRWEGRAGLLNAHRPVWLRPGPALETTTHLGRAAATKSPLTQSPALDTSASALSAVEHGYSQ
jgi:hypothetical protein